MPLTATICVKYVSRAFFFPPLLYFSESAPAYMADGASSMRTKTQPATMKREQHYDHY